MTYNINRLDNIVKHIGVIHCTSNHNEAWVLKIEDQEYTFLIDSVNELPPEKILEDENILLFEISNKISLFSKETGCIRLLFSLYDDFSTVEIVYNGYLIITDTSIVHISKYSFSITKVKIFSDLIQDVKLKEKKIMVETFSDQIFEVPI
ncbi:hypothetical protein [Mangrovimonas cancribranchiae]|uniref:Uncharacterized protein n=1 Tax=Mangrovimonas cancribranchiae TaxID=3080055 RepID=A0AAU6NXG2_9FLAO